MEIMVNSYHHQGVKRLAQRFVPIAFALDGLVEGFYDPNTYNPEDGKFIMGLQFHPERMRHQDSDEFDYPGCTMAYQEFVKAVIAYEKKLSCSTFVPRTTKLSEEMELRRKVILTRFSVARNIYKSGSQVIANQSSELEAGAEFLQANTTLSLQPENRLKQVGATTKNGSVYTHKLKMNLEREKATRTMMGNMSIEKLSELMSFYGLMRQISSETLETKMQELSLEEGIS